MNRELIGLIALIIALAIIIPTTIIIFIRGFKYKKGSKKIDVGMSFDEVEKMLGAPDSTKLSNDLKTCVWIKNAIPRLGLYMGSITCIVVFKDDKVVSAVINQNN